MDAHSRRIGDMENFFESLQQPSEPVNMVSDAEPMNYREYILDTAKQAVLRDRNSEYGNPEDNFRMIADLWNVLFKTSFLPHEVAMAMECVKLSRMTTSPGSLDHWIDAAGYAACGGETVTRTIHEIIARHDTARS